MKPNDKDNAGLLPSEVLLIHPNGDIHDFNLNNPASADDLIGTIDFELDKGGADWLGICKRDLQADKQAEVQKRIAVNLIANAPPEPPADAVERAKAFVENSSVFPSHTKPTATKAVAEFAAQEAARSWREVGHSCKWEEDEDGVWTTACGNAFAFDNEGPKENEAKYCQYCGGTLTPEPFTPKHGGGDGL